ncbi:MAG TPA: hypothetical protein VGM91_04175 [Conexibacter sp.]
MCKPRVAGVGFASLLGLTALVGGLVYANRDAIGNAIMGEAIKHPQLLATGAKVLGPGQVANYAGDALVEGLENAANTPIDALSPTEHLADAGKALIKVLPGGGLLTGAGELAKMAGNNQEILATVYEVAKDLGRSTACKPRRSTGLARPQPQRSCSVSHRLRGDALLLSREAVAQTGSWSGRPRCSDRLHGAPGRAAGPLPRLPRCDSGYGFPTNRSRSSRASSTCALAATTAESSAMVLTSEAARSLTTPKRRAR